MSTLAIVDPLSVVIQAALDFPALKDVVDTRIADRHRYGQDEGDWEQDKPALTISTLSGTPPNLDLPLHRIALQAVCYGDTFADAGQVLLALQQFTRLTERKYIDVTEGVALLYLINLTSSPSKLVLDEVRASGGMPAYVVTMLAEVAEAYC